MTNLSPNQRHQKREAYNQLIGSRYRTLTKSVKNALKLGLMEFCDKKCKFQKTILLILCANFCQFLFLVILSWPVYKTVSPEILLLLFKMINKRCFLRLQVTTIMALHYSQYLQTDNLKVFAANNPKLSTIASVTEVSYVTAETNHSFTYFINMTSLDWFKQQNELAKWSQVVCDAFTKSPPVILC